MMYERIDPLKIAKGYAVLDNIYTWVVLQFPISVEEIIYLERRFLCFSLLFLYLFSRNTFSREKFVDLIRFFIFITKNVFTRKLEFYASFDFK